MILKSSKNILIVLILFSSFFSDVKVNATSEQDDLKNWFNNSFWYKSKGMMIFDKALCEVKKSKNKIPQDCKEKNITEIKYDADFLRKLKCEKFIKDRFNFEAKVNLKNKIIDDCKRIFHTYKSDFNFDPEDHFSLNYIKFAVNAELPHYEGGIIDGQKEGKGIQYFKDGTIYLGEFKENKWNGEGKLIYQSGLRYIGDFQDGKVNGYGVINYPSGARYEGLFKNSQRNGLGTLYESNGEVYKGQFKNNKKHGRGEQIDLFEEKYLGYWIDNAKNGKGILFNENGKVLKQGIWENDILLKSKKIDQESLVDINESILITKEIRHERCLNASDYEGCMNYQSEKSKEPVVMNKKSEKEKCFGQGESKICIANKGKDFLGMEKLTGWQYMNDLVNSSVYYWEIKPRKVKVRGKYGRYIEIRSFVRKLVSPSAGSPPSIIGGTRVDCYNSGYGSISCSSNSPTIIGGVPSSPGGVGNILVRNIIDCKDKTFQSITKGNLPMAYGRIREKSKWKKIKSDDNYQIRNTSEKYCGQIDSLNSSDFTKYE